MELNKYDVSQKNIFRIKPFFHFTVISWDSDF